MTDLSFADFIDYLQRNPLIAATVALLSALPIVVIWEFEIKKRLNRPYEELLEQEQADERKVQLTKHQIIVPTQIGIVTFESDDAAQDEAIKDRIISLTDFHENVDLKSYEPHIGAKIIRVDRIAKKGKTGGIYG